MKRIFRFCGAGIIFLVFANSVYAPEADLFPLTLKGHTEFVNSVSFSPDAKYLASGSDDKRIKIWSVSDGSLIRTLEGHTYPVYSVSFSPDGKYLASGGYDKTIKIWSFPEGSLIRTLKGHTNWVWSVSFSPDGRYLASGSDDETIKVWSLPEGSLIKTLEGHTAGVLSVSFSPDGRYLASGSWDKTIKVWSFPDGFLIKTLQDIGAVGSVSFSPDGRYLVSGSDDETIKIWSLLEGSLVKILEGHTASVLSVSFSPNGRYLASGSDDNTIKVWSIPEGSLIETLKGHTDWVRSVSFSPDGRYLASGSRDNTIKVWSIREILGVDILAKVANPTLEEEKPIVEKPVTPSGKKILVAVAEFEAKNVSAMDAVMISDFFRTELFKTGCFRVVERKNMEMILVEQRFQLAGCTDQICAVKIGRLLNVEKVIIGSFGKLLDTYYVNFNLVDVETGEIIYADKIRAYSSEEVEKGIEVLANKLAKKYGGK